MEARSASQVWKARDVTQVWLPAVLLREMAKTAEEWQPFEGGGVFAGYWATRHSAAVITHVVHAGPGADHRTTGMRPDAEYQEAELLRIFEATDGVSYYLGDWHSHPGMAAVPSPTDRRTLRRIASETEAAAPQPLMLILANQDEKWAVIGWQGRFGLLGRFGPLHVDAVELRVG